MDNKDKATAKKTNAKNASTKNSSAKIAPPKKAPVKKATNTAVAKKAPSKKAPVTKSTAKKKILFVTSEAAPFVRTGGLGDVARALPKSLIKQGYDVRVIMPLYEAISSDFKSLMRAKGNKIVTLSWREQYAGLLELTTVDGIKFYFVDNEFYFKRSGLYGHFDDAERFAFFSRAVLELMPLLDFEPDVLHCNDWHTALVPVFLDAFYREEKMYKDIKTVFTIHNIKFQGIYDRFLIDDMLGLPIDCHSIVEYGNCLNFMKGGIERANVVTTVSETYANEILDPYYAYGLESILAARQYKVFGIVNGIDTELFNPANDTSLFQNYDINTIEKKTLNKKGLCDMLRLKYDENKPMIAMITRLTSQKGVDLVSAVIEDILTADVQFVLLGTGEWKYERLFKELEIRRGAKFKALINFSDDLAAKIYGASDMFLMPSKFEPCGLGQLIAMTYGSIPIVRETGGLKDTVIPYNPSSKEGTGFTFFTYNAHDMLNSIWSAVDTYYNRKKDWAQIQKNGMTKDFSWTKSAKKYIDLYDKI